MPLMSTRSTSVSSRSRSHDTSARMSDTRHRAVRPARTADERKRRLKTEERTGEVRRTQRVASSNKTKRRRAVSHKRSMVAIGLIVLLLAVVLALKTHSLQSQNAKYDAKIAELQQQIEDEQARSEELEERSVYVTTNRYIEEVARERLGLVYPGEILVTPDN